MTQESWIILGLVAAAVLIATAAVATTIAWRGGMRVPHLPHWTPAQAWRMLRRVVVTIVGATVLLVGVALLVLPGPATLVIPAGLAILATEFAWARRLLRRAKETLQQSGEWGRAALSSANWGRKNKQAKRRDESDRDAA